MSKGSSNHYCSVPNCKSWAKRNKNISFHLFPPKNDVLKVKSVITGNFQSLNRRKLWINRLKIGKPLTPYMKVCSLHFTENDYFIGSRQKKRLKKTAVPSLKLPLTYIKKRKHIKTIEAKKAVNNECQDATDVKIKPPEIPLEDEIIAAEALLRLLNKSSQCKSFKNFNTEVNSYCES